MTEIIKEMVEKFDRKGCGEWVAGVASGPPCKEVNKEVLA